MVLRNFRRSEDVFLRMGGEGRAKGPRRVWGGAFERVWPPVLLIRVELTHPATVAAHGASQVAAGRGTC